MKKVSCFAVAMFLLLVWSAAQTEEVDVKSLPGYVDLEDIKIPADAGKMTEISLGPGLLRMAQKSSENGDEELTNALSSLVCIQLKSFEIDSEDADEIRAIMKRIELKLSKENWDRLITSKDEHEFTIVSVKRVDDTVVGLLVMTLESDREVTFANIVGDLNLGGFVIGDLNLGNLPHLKATEGIEKSEKEQ